MIDNYLTYIILAITITAIPGPAVFLTIQNRLKYGQQKAIANILGNFFAMVLLATISAIGLGAVILASPLLFTIIKFLGCFYLIYLGIKIFRSSNNQAVENQLLPDKSFFALLKEGFYIGLSNPKAIAFFTALFPQFINENRDYFTQFLTLILTIEGVSFIVLFAYAFFAGLLIQQLKNPKTMAYFNKLTATAFIGFGVALLYKE